MNKAQDYIEKVKRHQFWILCGLVALVGLVSWWFATRSLADTYTKNKQKIEGEAGKIVKVKEIVEHPNERWNEKIGELVKVEKEEVKKAWQRLYTEQKNKVYVWPADVLGQDFVDAVQNLQPGEELPPDLLNRYWTEVLKQFEKFAKMVDAEYQDPTKATAAAFGGERNNPLAGQPIPGQVPHKVNWYGQAELQAPYAWAQAPTTLQVQYAQEELWVIYAICQAIAKANEGSAGAHDAAVRTIEQMSVGYLAAEEHPNGMKEPGRVTRLKAQLVAAGGGGGYGAVGGGPSTGEGAVGASGGGLVRPPRLDIAGGSKAGYGAVGGTSDAAGATAAASTSPDENLKEWRYVDRYSAPLRAVDLANPPFYEYRLMPWRVRMTVDQRKWDELLVMFRNTDLPLAIRQVRVNPTDGLSGFGGGGGRGSDSRGGGGYGATSGGGYGATSGRAGYGATSRGEGREAGGDRGRGVPSPFGTMPQTGEQTITLELRGVAYLMNPPDFSKIGVAGTTTALDAGAAAPAAAAAAAPAPDNPFGSTPAAVPAPVQSGPPPGSTYGSGR